MQVQRSAYLDKPKMRTSIPDAANLADRLRVTAGLDAVAPRAQGFALATSGARSYGVPVIGVEPAREPGVSTLPGLIKRGRYLKDVRANEAVIGARLAKNLRIDVGQELTLLGGGRDGSVAATVVPVVGIFETGMPDLDRQLIQVPLGMFQEVFSMGNHAHVIVIGGASLDAIETVQRKVVAALPAGADLRVRGWPELIPGLKQLIEADTVQNWFTYIVLIVVVTLSILNTFLMSVLERTREFGILLALGATPRRIGGMVLLESFLLTALGLLVGVMLGYFVALYFQRYGFTFPGMKELHAQFGLPGVIHPKITLVSLTLGPLVILLFTLLAALYPATRLRRLDPVEAMHRI
jgi:ABC-type lipoprotein release transport system permease subunit